MDALLLDEALINSLTQNLLGRATRLSNRMVASFDISKARRSLREMHATASQKRTLALKFAAVLQHVDLYDRVEIARAVLDDAFGESHIEFKLVIITTIVELLNSSTRDFN